MVFDCMEAISGIFVSKVILSFFKMGYWGDMFSAVLFLVVLCLLCELTKDHTYNNLKTICITYLKKQRKQDEYKKNYTIPNKEFGVAPFKKV